MFYAFLFGGKTTLNGGHPSGRVLRIDAGDWAEGGGVICFLGNEPSAGPQSELTLKRSGSATMKRFGSGRRDSAVSKSPQVGSCSVRSVCRVTNESDGRAGSTGFRRSAITVGRSVRAAFSPGMVGVSVENPPRSLLWAGSPIHPPVLAEVVPLILDDYGRRVQWARADRWESAKPQTKSFCPAAVFARHPSLP